ncbi:MAG: hypothetical protein HDR17_13345 [Lachnospiraceae bacterium]|nr:hypothetical protein [Lachnospiraceae bacterium]
MAFTNDLLLKTLQCINLYGKREIAEKSFLMLGKQELHLDQAFMEILAEAGYIEDISKFGIDELNDSVLFMKALGFKEVHALDVSGYEHADIIFDLNDKLPKELENRFDVVFDGGVIEHVFNITNAFLNICKMTKIGGYIFNLNPVYNYIHNTYWNISPEMFLDFYSVNKYKVLECSLITFLTEDEEKRAWKDRPVEWSQDVRLMALRGGLCTGEYVRSLHKLCPNPLPHIFAVAQKTNDEEFIYPVVSGYAKRHKEYEERMQKNK